MRGGGIWVGVLVGLLKVEEQSRVEVSIFGLC